MTNMNPSQSVRSMKNIIYGFYTCKTDIPRLLFEGFKGTPMAEANNCNVYIDINSILNEVMKYPTSTEHHYEFAISILNMVAHYRSVLRGHPYNMNPMFYLVYSDLKNQMSAKCKTASGHNTKPIYWNELSRIENTPSVFSIIFESIKLLKMVCEYIPNVKFLSAAKSVFHAEPYLIIYNNIKRFESEHIPNIIISKDAFTFQIPVYTESIVLRPKKTFKNGQVFDTSYVVNRSNAIFHAIKPKEEVPHTSSIWTLAAYPPTLWPLVVSLVCLPNDRSTKYGMTLYDATNIISSNMAQHKLSTQITYAGLQYLYYPKRGKFRPNDFRNIISENFRCDVNLLYSMYQNTPESTDITWNVYKSDMDGLKYLNDNIFCESFVDFMSIIN